jgi:VCBS repeat-containing protein
MSRSVARALGYALIALAVMECGEPTTAPTPVPSESGVPHFDVIEGPALPYPILAGAGDIANCTVGNDNDGSTARLLDAIFANGQPGNVMMLGEPDETATAENYPGCFVDTWGRHLAIMRPMPGNKDYINGNLDHYFRYFGAAAGDPPGGYYSFDAGEYWHVVVINSNNTFVPTNSDAAPQVAWLRNDLLLNTKPCIAAYMHHPRFFSSTTPNVSTEAGQLRPVWNELDKHGAEFVSSGNRHHYERLKPMRADGTVDLARGIIQFITGTGGTSLGLPQEGTGSIHPNSEVRGVDYGVVKFTLKPDSYDWQFVPARNRFNDAGSATCHPPTIPVSLVVTSSSPSSVYGQPVTFTAKAEDGSNTVRVGTVSFISGGTCEMPVTVLESGINLDETGRARTTVLTLDVPGSPHTIVACYTGAGSYMSSSGQIAHSVTKNTATVTLGDLAATYDGQPKTASATTVPADLQVSLTYVNAADVAVSAPIDAGDYTVTGTVEDPNYSGSASDLFRIAKATPLITWPPPAPITYGTALGATQLNATASFNGQTVPGSFTYTPAAGTVLDAGPDQVLSADFAPAAAGNFNSVVGTTVLISVGGASQTIDFASPGDKTFGDPPFELSATATSGLPVSFSAIGACSVASTTVTINQAGGCTLTASQGGNANYQPADDVVRSILIAKKSATVTLGSLFHNYDGQPKSASASTDAPGESAFHFEYQRNGTAVAQPTDAGTYNVVATLINANYQGSASGTLVINGGPVATADAYSVDEDGTLSIAAPGVIGNDVDSDGGTITPSLVSSTSNGTLQFNSDGSFAYAPRRDFNGSDAFSYRISDGNLSSDPATVTITVNPVNDAPVAIARSVSTAEDRPLSITLAASDIEGDALTFEITAGPTNGSLAPTGTAGTYTYTPNANFNGTDEFTFTASDGTPSAPATVTISVGAVNDAPIASDDQYAVDEDNVLTTAGVQSVLANDTDADGDPLTASLVAGRGPSNGTLTFNADGTFTYTPNPNFHGVDAFTYQATDGNGRWTSATVAITVNAINDAPAATDDPGYAVSEDQTLTTTAATGVLANDTDVDDAQLTALVVTPPAFGSLTLNADGSFTYKPNADFNGTDSFVYRASDGRLTSNDATVTIAVETANDAPVAADDAFDVVEDTPRTLSVLANDSDTEASPLTPNLVDGQGPANGTVTLNAGGTSFDYAPNADFNGSDGFSYTVSDGSAISNVARVTITVTPVNDAPVAQPQAVTTDEHAPVAITLAGQDVENSQLAYRITAQPSHGSLSGEGNVYTYTPEVNYFGDDAFSFVVNDGTDDSDPAKVSITVNRVNDLPQSITFGELQDKKYGDPDFDVSASASSGLTVQFGASGDCTVSGKTVSILRAGNCTVTASQPGDETYLAAADVARSFSIGKGAITVAADNQSRMYGAANPPLTGVLTGVKAGDNITASYATAAVPASAVGGYPIDPTLSDPDTKLPNYDVQSTSGVLTITRAPLSAKADNKARPYGEDNPPLTGSLEGVRNNDDITVEFLTEAGRSSAVGDYAIKPTLKDPTNKLSNYDVSTTDGVLSVGKAGQSITFDALANKTYGDAAVPLAASATSGLAVTFSATGACTLAGTSVTLAAAGTCTVTASQPGNDSYTAADNVVRSFTINKAPLTVKADDATRTYGAANPALTGSMTGVTNGDDITATYSTTAEQGSPVGSYAIAPALSDPGNKLGNYDVTSLNGSLTVTKAVLTAQADNKSRPYGEANPPLTGILTGVVNGDRITAEYATDATAESPAGEYAIRPSLVDPDTKLTNYDITLINGKLTIGKSGQTITFAELPAKTYGDPAFAVSATASSGLAVALAAVGNCSLAGGVLSVTGAGSCTVTASQPGNESFAAAAEVARTFVIAKAALTVRADNKSRGFGEQNPPLTGTLEGVRNGDAIVDSYSTDATAESPTGEYDIIASVSAPNGVLDNYNVTRLHAKLTVGKASQTITFAQPSDKTYGDPSFSVSATATSSLTVAFAASGNCSIAGTTVTILAAGGCTVTASQPGNESYGPAADVARSLLIRTATLTVTAENKSRAYGEANPTLTGTVTGLVNGDDVTATYATAATPTSPVGEYDIDPSVTSTNGELDNYDVALVKGKLTVGKAVQSIAFDALAPKTYGDAPFALSAEANSGLAVTFAATGNCTLSGASVSITAAGSCTITASQAGNAEYAAAADIARTFAIAKAALTVRADNKSRAYGEENPPLTGTLEGIRNGDQIADSYTTNATSESPAGEYDIIASVAAAAGVLDNYHVTSVAGKLTVGGASQTITFAQLTSKTYGDADVPLVASASSALPVSFSVSGDCALSGTSVKITGAGSCEVTASQAGDVNYNAAANVVRSFTIATAALRVAADDKFRLYGAANPILTGTLVGLRTGDNITATYSATATVQSDVGAYAITPTLIDPDNKLSNYEVSSLNGRLTVNKAPLTVKADDKSKLYGAPLPAFTASFAGFVLGENPSVLAGTVIFTTSATATSDVGSYAITPGGLTSSNYEVSFVSGTLTVGRATQSITFATLADRMYGDAAFDLSATASSGLAVGYAASGACSVSGSTVQVVTAGTCNITASQAGSSHYEPAPDIVRSFNVAPAPLTVTADNKSRVYGQANPPLTGTVDGARNGDILTGVYATTATTTSAAGEYRITASLSDPNGKLPNYAVSYNHGTLSIAPAAADDPSYTVAEDQTLTTVAAASVLANDGGGEGIQLVAELVEGPPEAATDAFTLNTDGTFSYSPAANFNGSVTFRYRAKVGAGASSNVATATITVTQVNDAPGFTKGADQVVADDAGLQTLTGWASNIGSGPPNEAGQSLTFEVTANTNATLFEVAPAVSPSGTLSYTPAPNANGTAAVTILVRDNGGTVGGGIDASAPQTFTITVQRVNDAPVSTGDSYSADEDRQLTVAAAGVLANDADPDVGDVLQAVLVSGPSSGTLVLNQDGSFIYTPNLHFSGNDAFSYRATDGLASSDAVSVAITVKARMTVLLDILPGSSTNSIGYSTSQTQIVFAVLSTATFDATLLDPATVTLGNDQGTDTPLAKNADGSLKFLLADVTGDGRRDFYAYVNKAEMKANGDLTLTTTSMTVLGRLKAPRTELFRGKDKVTVVP